MSFCQEIWVSENCREDDPYKISKKNKECYIPMMALSEILSSLRKPTTRTALSVMKALACVEEPSTEIKKAILRLNTSAPHVHAMHSYKAKFFPRFVKSLIVSHVDLDNISNVRIYDPYVGSGTTLVECALMGMESIGTDIDPLSCFISDTKAQSLEMDASSIWMGNKTECKE